MFRALALGLAVLPPPGVSLAQVLEAPPVASVAPTAAAPALTPEGVRALEIYAEPRFKYDQDMLIDLESLNYPYRDVAIEPAKRAALGVLFRAITRPVEQWPREWEAALPMSIRKSLAEKAERLQTAAKSRPELDVKLAEIRQALGETRGDEAPARPAPLPARTEEARRFAERVEAAFNTRSALVLAGPDYKSEAERVLAFAKEARAEFGREGWGSPEDRADFQKFVAIANAKSRFHSSEADWAAYSSDQENGKEATAIFRHFFAPYWVVTEAVVRTPAAAEGPVIEEYLLKGLAHLHELMSHRPALSVKSASEGSRRIKVRTEKANKLLDCFLNAVDALIAAKSPFLTPAFGGAVQGRLEAIVAQSGWTEDVKHKSRLVLEELKKVIPPPVAAAKKEPEFSIIENIGYPVAIVSGIAGAVSAMYGVDKLTEHWETIFGVLALLVALVAGFFAAAAPLVMLTGWLNDRIKRAETPDAPVSEEMSEIEAELDLKKRIEDAARAAGIVEPPIKARVDGSDADGEAAVEEDEVDTPAERGARSIR